MTKEDALNRLREVLKPGDTVYCILRHVSASGMSRRISFMVFKEGRPFYLDYLISEAGMGYRSDRKNEGLIVRGCGMDMGFAVVYDLGAALWPEGTPEPHSTRNGEPDTSGGFALKHYWL